MMVIRDIREKDYPSFLKLYNEAFPVAERRLYRDAGQLENFIRDKYGLFSGFVAEDEEGVFLGFLAYWKYSKLIYLEYFAVDGSHRGRNIEGKMLNYLLEDIREDVLFEVEKPETPEAERRIRFYERYGFRVRREIEYVQPPYSPVQSGVKMDIMTHGEVRLNGTEDLREIYTEVYDVKDTFFKSRSLL